MSETVVPSVDRDYDESKLVYWNDFEMVREHLNTLISGDPRTDWMKWLTERHTPFERVLALNCGDGVMERGLFKHGVAKSVVGVDVSGSALADARRAADELGMPAEYIEFDANLDPLPPGPFDLILNHAALHHVAYIDRVVRGAREVIADSGLLVHYDYTGAHRNQYGAEAWAATLVFNASLPEPFRNGSLDYPHLPTMLTIDPTEAIHSELILETLDRYFESELTVPLGGSISYPVLYQNHALFDAEATDDGRAVLQSIIDRDREHLDGDPAGSTFTFAVMRPRPGALDDEDQLAAWTAEERGREGAAAANGGEYYPHTAFGIVYGELADTRDREAALAKAAADIPVAELQTPPFGRRLYHGLERRARAVVRRLRRLGSAG